MNSPSRGGRPAFDRGELLALLQTLPRQGRRLVRLNETQAAKRLGWHRATVKRALDDLEHEGCVRRFSALGHRGLLVELLA